jgi:hypothetical protein
MFMKRIPRTVLPAIVATGLLIGAQPANAEPAAAAPPEASTFTSLAPVRVLDTRNGTGGFSVPVPADTAIGLDLGARVPATATAVVLNVTGVAPTASTFVTVFPSGPKPTASNLNLLAGETKANQVTVQIGADLDLNLYNRNGAVDLIADLAGYYSPEPGAGFTALPANRVLDTRTGSAVGPGATRELDLTNRIPASATAVTFNLTGTGPTASTFVTAWPTGTTRPTASNLNVTAGETRPNLVTVAVGANRRVSLYNLSGQIHLLADLTGFYTPEYGAYFVPFAPSRVLDTREGIGTGGARTPVGPDSSIPLAFGTAVPASTTGVVLNLTGVAATTTTFVTAWPRFQIRPDASTLNLTAGKAVPNAAMVAFETERAVELYNRNGSVHLIADLAGVFAVYDTPCAADCVLAWGRNSNRQLGIADTEFFSPTPKPILLSGVRTVTNSYGNNGYALRTDGTVLAWGDNRAGQLGNGWTGGGSAAPVPVLGLTGVTAITASRDAAFALRSDGTVWSWGGNTYGVLGVGGSAPSNVPAKVSGLTTIVGISAGIETVYAVRANGSVAAWGRNHFGEHGSGAAVESLPTPTPVSISGVASVEGGGNGAYALKTDGTVWAWGYGRQGQLGNGQPCDPDESVRCESRVPVQVSGLTGVTSIAGGLANGYAALGDGTVWAWGASYRGHLGEGTECDPGFGDCASIVPVRVTGLTNVTKVAAADSGGYALRSDGSVVAWGENALGSLGNESVPGYSTVPVAVTGLSGVSAVVGGGDAGYAIVP